MHIQHIQGLHVKPLQQDTKQQVADRWSRAASGNLLRKVHQVSSWTDWTGAHRDKVILVSLVGRPVSKPRNTDGLVIVQGIR